MKPNEVFEILAAAKTLAQRYRAITGKPLGVTGEVAEFEAARLLGVKLTPARQAGFDAVEITQGVERRLQIKGRCVLDAKRSQRIGSIKTTSDWDAVLLVLLTADLEASEIYEADRGAVIAALSAPGSKARNDRGALSVTKFKSIARLRWRRRTPH